MRNPKILVLERSDELADQVRGVVDDMRPRPQVTSCTRVGGVGELIADDGPFEVLLAGSSLATKTGLQRLQRLRDDYPAMAMVLAFDHRPDGRLRDIVRIGAVDLLQLPIDDGVLLESVARAVDLAAARGPQAGTLAGGSGSTSAAPGHVFTISSATGGCGKTFYATNLAYFLTQHTGKRACIVDLDLQFGEVSTGLRLRPRYTISDALQRADETEDAELAAHIDDYVVTHETGIHILAAPKDPSEADRISPPDVTRVIEAIRARYDYVIVDTPSALTETVLAALDLSDELYVMATLDLPSVRNMAVFLNTLEKLKISSENVRLILNKEESDVGISTAQVTKMFSQGFSSVLPYSKEVSKSINVGMPVLGFSPRSDVSRRMADGMKLLLPEDQRHLVESNNGAVPAGFLSKLFRRHSPQLSNS
jgi:pilus assembly protein CpaE